MLAEGNSLFCSFFWQGQFACIQEKEVCFWCKTYLLIFYMHLEWYLHLCLSKPGRERETLFFFFFGLLSSSLFGFNSGLSRRCESATSGWASRWTIKVFCCPPGVVVGDHRRPWRSQLKRWHGLRIENTVFRLTEGSFEVIVVCLIGSAWNLGNWFTWIHEYWWPAYNELTLILVWGQGRNYFIVYFNTFIYMILKTHRLHIRLHCLKLQFKPWSFFFFFK